MLPRETPQRLCSRVCLFVWTAAVDTRCSGSTAMVEALCVSRDGVWRLSRATSDCVRSRCPTVPVMSSLRGVCCLWSLRLYDCVVAVGAHSRTDTMHDANRPYSGPHAIQLWAASLAARDPTSKLAR